MRPHFPLWRLVFFCWSLWLLPSADAEELWVGRFEAKDAGLPSPWRIEQLDPRVPATRYRLFQWEGVNAIEAQAQASMALLVRPLAVDLEKTPILCWRWRIDQTLQKADMRTKAGDDYAARLYLTFRLPPEELDWRTKAQLALAYAMYGHQVPDAALNYVWDNRFTPETFMKNAYTDQVEMIVVRSGNADAGRWIAEQRNVRADFQRAFGAIAGQLTGLAIASDTDNTGENAHAGFAEIRFVKDPSSCP